jgi:hypothetical protein
VIDAFVGWLVIAVGWAAAQAIGHIPLPQLWRQRSRLASDARPAREESGVVGEA